MLSIPFKRTDNVKFFKSCEKYLRKNYDKATIEKIRPYLTEGDGFRDQVVSGSNVSYDVLNQSILSTSIYYRFIKSIESRIPIASTDLKFTWYDSITRKKYPVQSYRLEKSCLLYHLGSLYSRLGSEIDLCSSEAHKTALNAFQCAMGCLNEIRNQGSDSRIESNIDLAAEHISMLISILTAQCYYIMYDRLDKGTANKANLAKLSYTISKNFDQAYCAAISQKLVRSFPEEFKNMLKFQSSLHLALSSYWMSFPEREEGLSLGRGFGRGVARLRNAMENITRALQIRKVKGVLADAGKNVHSMITREKELAESENMSIYMDGIPDFKCLPAIEELLMVQPRFPPPADIDSAIRGQEVLLCLVPKEVTALAAEYKDLVLQLTTTEASKIAGLVREITTALDSMCLPQKINALSNETGLPEAIWTKIQQVQVSGGYFQLENSMASLKQLGENCQKSLAELMGTIAREEEEDRSLRETYTNQWSRAMSQALNSNFREAMEKYSMKLAQAISMDENNCRTWEGIQDVMQLLKKGKNELDEVVPANEVQQGDSGAAERLREALEQMRAAQQALDEILKGLVADAEHDNITEVLLKLVEAKLPKEHTFTVELAKFDVKKAEIDAKIGETRNVLRIISQENAEFERIKGNVQPNPQRVRILTQLESAVKVYTDLSRIFSQGHQFYANFSTHLSIMNQKVSDFIFSRDIEKNELLSRISGKTPQPTPESAPNPYEYFYPKESGQFK